jgi:hypothetical protein
LVDGRPADGRVELGHGARRDNQAASSKRSALPPPRSLELARAGGTHSGTEHLKMLLQAEQSLVRAQRRVELVLERLRDDWEGEQGPLFE